MNKFLFFYFFILINSYCSITNFKKLSLEEKEEIKDFLSLCVQHLGFSPTKEIESSCLNEENLSFNNLSHKQLKNLNKNLKELQESLNLADIEKYHDDYYLSKNLKIFEQKIKDIEIQNEKFLILLLI